MPGKSKELKRPGAAAEEIDDNGRDASRLPPVQLGNWDEGERARCMPPDETVCHARASLFSMEWSMVSGQVSPPYVPNVSTRTAGEYLEPAGLYQSRS
jgi:hypothetical protein